MSSIDSGSLAAAYPNAKSRLAVFVHGLCETDDAWKLGAVRHVPYGHRMEIELGYSPLYVRYNTGRHISENGREFAIALEDLVAAWPARVDEIVLIGHSMGGLVAAARATTAPTASASAQGPPRVHARRAAPRRAARAGHERGQRGAARGCRRPGRSPGR